MHGYSSTTLSVALPVYFILWGFMPETEGHFNQPGAITPQNGYFVILSLQ
ncbi:hypothetical protein ECAD30_28500 [Escherichia coli AD30]|nr:hypothetical protein ECAD30_28500 [Escherichia coli AD30]